MNIFYPRTLLKKQRSHGTGRTGGTQGVRSGLGLRTGAGQAVSCFALHCEIIGRTHLTCRTRPAGGADTDAVVSGPLDHAGASVVAWGGGAAVDFLRARARGGGGGVWGKVSSRFAWPDVEGRGPIHLASGAGEGRDAKAGAGVARAAVQARVRAVAPGNVAAVQPAAVCGVADARDGGVGRVGVGVVAGGGGVSFVGRRAAAVRPAAHQ
ncbi:hypothetical protein DFJ74DRAFT_57330 [Hyaloraphidium curvatum]|nr:hypothetical protein DFJ74DRAFT_57330 [Hyaloraphidium curvatum]